MVLYSSVIISLNYVLMVWHLDNKNIIALLEVPYASKIICLPHATDVLYIHKH